MFLDPKFLRVFVLNSNEVLNKNRLIRLIIPATRKIKGPEFNPFLSNRLFVLKSEIDLAIIRIAISSKNNINPLLEPDNIMPREKIPSIK
jgi:hypothetical protein